MSDPVSIIGGSGALGFGLAVRLGQAGVPIVIGSPVADRAQELGEDVLVWGDAKADKERVTELIERIAGQTDAGIRVTDLPGRA